MNDHPTSDPEGRKSPGQLVPVTRLVPARRDAYGPLVGYGDNFADAPDDTEGWDLLQYWRIFAAYKWLILSIAVAFVALGAVRTLMQTPLYTATARLQIDDPTNVVEGGEVTPHKQTDSQSMRTQYELLRSRAMAKRVASSLKLGNDADFLKPREFSIIGAAKGLLNPSSPKTEGPDASALERQATNVVWNNVSVRPVSGSRLVDIAYSDPSPDRARKVANAFAEAAIDTSIDKRFQANAYAKTFLEDKIDQLKLRLEDSERALVAFAESEEIVKVQERESITETNLATAHQVGTETIESLRKLRNELELEYEEKLETFKPAYPTMVQIKTKLEGLDRQIASETKGMQTKVAALKAELLDLQKRSIQYNILKREVDTNRELYQNLLQRYKEVDVAGGVVANNIFVVDAATRPGAPSSPNLVRALMQSLAFGFLFGCAAAYGLNRIDNKVRSGEDLEKLAGLPVLGVIPKVRGDDVTEELADPRSVLSEAYRSLATSLQFTTENGLPKSLLITSAGPGEGKSLTALSIAKHFAVMGRKVLLIDADLRNPSLHTKLGTDNSIGLSNYLTGASAPPETMQKTGVPNLAFIASGPLPPNAADLLASSRLVSLLSVGLEVFDLIIIDGPPVLGLADAQLLSSATAATLFTVAAGETRTGVIRGALKRLALSQGFVIGAVLTKFDAKLGGYGDSYGYGYGYGYGADADPRGLVVQATDTSKPQLTDARESA